LINYLSIKKFFYRICKMLGLFKVSRFLSRYSLRILCYHGFEIFDESNFRPLTFIKKSTFENRLSLIKNNNIEVIPLDDAIRLLNENKLPPSAIVITIDDGFYSTYKYALPLLQEYSFPAVVYLTTYYVIKQTPVFRLVVQYMFWKSEEEKLEISGLAGSDRGFLNITESLMKKRVTWTIISYGEKECNQSEREVILEKLGNRLKVNYDRIKKSRMFSMMNFEELKELQSKCINLELHTHRHIFPIDREKAISEIKENRNILENELKIRANHFCYPSGYWDSKQFLWMKEMGIKSGVTCDQGLNYGSSSVLALKRFLDGENISEIEFEAEILGFSEIMRKIKKLFTKNTSTKSYKTENY